ADWMPRNLNRRVELMYPIGDVDHRQRMKDILAVYFSDNVKARMLRADGNWERVVAADGVELVNAQEVLLAAVRQNEPVVDATPRPKRSSPTN
ncbi:MAG: hypothetical protein H7X80_07400, partial [bacterium]|nr:hypothetical protein [Candidatus Kapabacteria bacterium]